MEGPSTERRPKEESHAKKMLRAAIFGAALIGGTAAPDTADASKYKETMARQAAAAKARGFPVQEIQPSYNRSIRSHRMTEQEEARTRARAEEQQRARWEQVGQYEQGDTLETEYGSLKLFIYAEGTHALRKHNIFYSNGFLSNGSQQMHLTETIPTAQLGGDMIISDDKESGKIFIEHRYYDQTLHGYASKRYLMDSNFSVTPLSRQRTR